MARRGASLWLLLLVAWFAMPGDVFGAAAVNITKVQVNGKDVGSLSKIHVRESAPISITFSYEADSNTDVNSWQVWIDKADSGAMFDNGDFSGSTATVTFTTDDIGRQVRGLGLTQIPWRTKPTYDYVMVVKILSTDKPINNPVDGDEDYDYNDDYNDGDGNTTDETIITNKPTAQVTIRVDEDPPLAPTLNSDPTPGERNLLLSWEEGILSESGEKEQDGVRVMFCVREASAQDIPALAFALPGLYDVDGDEEAAADGDYDDESYPDGDEPLDGDLPGDGDDIGDGDEPVDGDLPPDGDVPADGDNAGDGDEPGDGDDPIREDGDEVEELEGCMEPMPESDGGGYSYRITGLENDVYYEVRGKSVDQAGNISRRWSAPVFGSPQEVDDFWEAYKNAGGKEKGGFCFIATATYGSYSADEVRVLRRFRDEVLSRSAIGRGFISAYYETSPPIAAWIERHEWAATVVRAMLNPVVALLAFAFGANPWVLLLLFGAPALLVAVGALAWAGRRWSKEVAR